MKLVIFIASIIGGITILAYTILMRIRKGKPLDSLSETAYLVSSPTTFASVLIVSSLLMMAQMMMKASDSIRFLGILFLFGMMMVGASNRYKTVDGRLHLTGAIVAAISSQLLIGLTDCRFLMIWTFYPILMLFIRKRGVFWTEVFCFITITTFNILG